MIIIADSGATKTEWALIGDDGWSGSVFTQGINPYFQDENAADAVIRDELLPQLDAGKCGHLFFYGAGISTDKNKAMLNDVLRKYFSGIVEVEHDLLGAARAVCGKEAGIACILGTGSNSCLYDGNEVIDNIRSGGFVISDEGSGAHIGKTLSRDFIYRRMPEEIAKLFPVSEEDLLDKIYRQPTPNRFVASLTMLAIESRHHSYIRRVVKDCFDEFLELRVLPYKDSRSLKVSFIGSVADTFRDILAQSLKEKGLSEGTIMKQPMLGLVNFHTK